MGMAEEIITTETLEKLCNGILQSNENIRFAGLVNNKSHLLASSQREDLDSLLRNDEIEMSINYTLESWRKAQNLSFRLGKEKLTLTEYDHVTLITIPFDGKLLLISTQPNVNYHEVIQSIISVIPPWEK